jgi:Tfp pilus assembly protein PilF
VTLTLALGLLALAGSQAGRPAPAGAAPSPPPAALTRPFEAMWAAYVAADAAGDQQAEARALGEIRRARMERNVDSLGPVGLALVGHAWSKLQQGERDQAEEELRAAVQLAPGLPDAHSGLAMALLRKGPVAYPASVEAALGGISAFVDTGWGGRRVRDLLTLAALAAAFATAWAIAIALLLRRGGLLRHDIEEWLGPAHHRSSSFALFLLALLLPVATFQGWGWLPLYWMALLYSYCSVRERALAVALAVAMLGIGPGATLLEERLRTTRNPLYHAALAVTESVPTAAATANVEAALARDPADRDLAYLLATARKKAGRYDEAGELYRQALAVAPEDEVARNNLANLEFIRGNVDGAAARYKLGTTSPRPDVAATSYYNLSLAHLRKFDYEAFNAAKSNADRLAPGLVSQYDRFKFDSGDYAVIDLELGREQVWRKFAGAESGVAARNLLQGEPPAPRTPLVAALANRFLGALAVLALVVLFVSRWRGRKAFTLHCARCGTAFCRLCHLGQASGSLCSQCYHLFVVRDGVSTPVRNRKLAEAQGTSATRERIARLLGIASPGAGQLYGGFTLVGAALVAAWYAVVGVWLASRLVPFSEVPSALSPPWFTLLTGLLLIAIWAAAFRLPALSEPELPKAATPRGAGTTGGSRRARTAQGAA